MFDVFGINKVQRRFCLATKQNPKKRKEAVDLLTIIRK